MILFFENNKNGFFIFTTLGGVLLPKTGHATFLFFCCCLLSKTKPKTNGTHFRHPNSFLCVYVLPLSLIVTISLIH